jgi:hypothetical protein
MDEYLVSQRQAVKMLRDLGLSRRAAYYRLNTIPSRILVDSRVYSRIDVELLIERLTRDVAGDAE